MSDWRPGPLTRRLLRAPTWLYRARLGVLLGHRFLMITHSGRRSGRLYRTVVEVVGRIPQQGEFVVLAGRGTRSDWLLNLEAGCGQQVDVGRARFRPDVRRLGEDEAVEVLAGYERRNRVAAPVVRRVLSWLTGWTYTGTDDDRRRLVRELPLVALRPASSTIR
jgi:deazaflavin-dependent oxidoreductase (nitroreductase family)